MKKFMLLMLGSAILTTSAFANDAKTQPSKPGEILKAGSIKKAFTNVLLYGTSSLTSTVYITATNTSTSQTYYLTVYSAFPSTGSNNISIPTGTYDISVSLSESASIYLNESGKVCDTYYTTFYGVQINTLTAKVVDVQYSCY